MDKQKSARLIQAMIEMYEGDAQRIQHFLKVWAFAKTIGELEGLDEAVQEVLETAAIVHDIGIRLCEKKYGRCSGNLQELEGPPLAEELLRKLGYDESLIRRTAYLVGHHHTYQDVDGMDYQILLEADFLVNSYEEASDRKTIEAFCKNVFRTESGIHMLKLQSGI